MTANLGRFINSLKLQRLPSEEPAMKHSNYFNSTGLIR